VEFFSNGFVETNLEQQTRASTRVVIEIPLDDLGIGGECLFHGVAASAVVDGLGEVQATGEKSQSQSEDEIPKSGEKHSASLFFLRVTGRVFVFGKGNLDGFAGDVEVLPSHGYRTRRTDRFSREEVFELVFTRFEGEEKLSLSVWISDGGDPLFDHDPRAKTRRQLVAKLIRSWSRRRPVSLRSHRDVRRRKRGFVHCIKTVFERVVVAKTKACSGRYHQRNGCGSTPSHKHENRNFGRLYFVFAHPRNA